MGATDSKRLDAGRQLASLRQQIANLERERKRFAELLEADAATEKQVDDIDYQIAVLHSQLAATSEQINSSNTSLGSQGEALRHNWHKWRTASASLSSPAPSRGQS